MQVKESIQIAPLDGRDYSSSQKAITDFDKGRNFIVLDIHNKYNGKPVNKLQLVGKYEQVTIRYNGLKRSTNIQLVWRSVSLARNTEW